MNASPSRLRTLLLRSLSTLVLWTIVLLALFAPSQNVGLLALLVSLSLIGITGFIELARMFSLAPDQKIPLSSPFLTTGLLILLDQSVRRVDAGEFHRIRQSNVGCHLAAVLADDN